MLTSYKVLENVANLTTKTAENNMPIRKPYCAPEPKKSPTKTYKKLCYVQTPPKLD